MSGTELVPFAENAESRVRAPRPAFSAILRVARADFQERSRRYGLLVTIAATIWFASLCIPPKGARYETVGFGDYRGVYNSAWIGGVFAVLTSVMLSLPGFYLVKSAIARDRETRVGEVLAATSVGTWAYLTAKALSNFAYLSLMSGTLAVGALVIQLARGEAGRVEPWALWSPFLLVVAPVMAMVAAFGVLFESIRWLRGSLGNAVFFFLWMILLMGSVTIGASGRRSLGAADLFGANLVLGSMADAARPVFPDGDPLRRAHVGFVIHAEPGWTSQTKTFLWNGVDWSAGRIAGRAAWVAAALAITALATLFFDRFDADRGAGAGRRHRGRGDRGEDSISLYRGEDANARIERPTALDRGEDVRVERPTTPGGVTSAGARSPRPIGALAGSPRLGGIVSAELRVAIKGLSRWWYAVAIALVIAGLAVPPGPARAMVLATAWLWPLSVFSSMGHRAIRHGVDEILDASPHPLRAQLPGLWLAGVLVAALAGSGVALRLVLAGDAGALAAWACGTLFVPSAALALGVWSGSSRLFEILALMLWYAGPMNQIPFLDYGGFTDAGRAAGVPFAFLGIAAACVAASFIGRHLAARR